MAELIKQAMKREADPLDEVIQRTIESFPHATRLYPDVYAFAVTNAVRSYLEEYEKVEEKTVRLNRLKRKL